MNGLEKKRKQLTDYTTASMSAIWDGELIEYEHPSSHTPTCYAYEAMRKLCLALPFKTYDCRCGIYRKVRDLSVDECKMAGEMMDEIIPIWNKYVKRLYEEKKSD